MPRSTTIRSSTPSGLFWSPIRRGWPGAVGASLLLLILFVAPSGAGVVGRRAVELAAESGFPQATYYRVRRPDLRLCPAPTCGGVFVERVNRRRVQCADGRRARECHAAIVDFSALGLTPAEEAALQSDFLNKRVLARGDLVLAASGFGIEVPTLLVSDAWRGVTGTQSKRGRYFGVVPSGIVCITFPCPSLLAIKLNGRRVQWLHSLDLNRSGASEEEIGLGLDELYQGPGLIAFGRFHKIIGPAGRGKELGATEFYTKIGSSAPRACGGFTFPPNPLCRSREFCEQPAGTCFVADLPGTCQAIPEACIESFDPVCGCDGVTYGNDCQRQRAQVALDHVGSCATLPPTTCGPATCDAGMNCCNPLLGICTSPGEGCVL